MVRETARRDVLAESATDYALRHGLIGLSLRPLAAAIGTSDRMLLYHFADKDDLVATVLRVANERSIVAVRSLPRSRDVRQSVVDLWHASTSGELDACQRLYVQAAALGLLGRQPYEKVVREANEVWLAAVTDHLQDAGCPPGRARRAAVLLDAAFMGLQLDLPLDRESPEQTQAVADLASAVAAVATGSSQEGSA
jgi:AcrR family transcriptional regulator